MELQEYKPMLEVKVYGGEKYYIEEANENAFVERIKVDKFIKIGNCTIATNQIISIKPPENKSDLVLIDYPSHIREAVLTHAQAQFKKLLRYPKEEMLVMWADKITKGESLT